MNQVQSKIVAFGLVVAIAGATAQLLLVPPASGQPAPKAGEKAGQPKPVTGPVVEGLTLAVQPLKKSYKVGEPILVKTNLKNVSKTTMQLGGIYYVYSNKFQVSRSDVKNVPLTLFGQQFYKGRSAQQYTIYLKPGKSIEYIFVLNRLYDLSWDGTYRVSVSTQVPKLSNENQLVAVKSNEVAITLEYTSALVDEEDLPKVEPKVDETQ